MVTHSFISYNMTKIWEIKVLIAKMISPVSIGGFVDKDRALLYMPRNWFDGQGVILEQCVRRPHSY